jgi:hypothetical protein
LQEDFTIYTHDDGRISIEAPNGVGIEFSEEAAVRLTLHLNSLFALRHREREESKQPERTA